MMEKIGVCQVTSSISKKDKKKKAKDEMERMKQAEKKKRRLEKALATSAAIITELEKKKQMKREEQQRLDEEGAAIAESVALNVLGDEEWDDYPLMMWSRGRMHNSYIHDTRTFGFFMDHPGSNNIIMPHRSEGLGIGSQSSVHDETRHDPNLVYMTPSTSNLGETVHDEQGTEFSLDLKAAEALSSLQIAES
ncbi:hypothetical protein ZOSMA_366G00140 [Zostera marina]|uniref:Uncharacterized protein n=1 Tax=Zostera marina TaxID=29655 RepID=A0A0K9P663_ZOSMR|nr:hypothetical protein ZOSMA_366G00140 [Zostera marina]